MLETGGSAGEGRTFPVGEWSLKQMTGVGAPPGKVQPDAAAYLHVIAELLGAYAAETLSW